VAVARSAADAIHFYLFSEVDEGATERLKRNRLAVTRGSDASVGRLAAAAAVS